MKNLIALLIIPILILVSCKKDEELCSTFTLADSDITDSVEYLIIESIYTEKFSEMGLVHIAQETYSEPDSGYFALYLKSDKLNFDSEKKEEYIALNSSVYTWGELFNDQQDLISEAELQCLFSPENHGWASYNAKYGDSKGYVKFGRPVQKNNKEAIVSYAYGCGWLCGSGHVVTLKKENGKWIIYKDIVVWIS